jgi:hypothetical protein
MKFESFLLHGLLICMEHTNVEMIIQPSGETPCRVYVTTCSEEAKHIAPGQVQPVARAG